MLAPALAETLRRIADEAAAAKDDWWIIGSAAVALHGGAVGPVRDVDLLMSERDAAALLRRAGIAPAPGVPDALFHSRVRGSWDAPPVPIDVLGGFSFATSEGWRELALATREAIAVGDRQLYVPAVAELKALLLSFGREKDLARAGLLGGDRRGGPQPGLTKRGRSIAFKRARHERSSGPRLEADEDVGRQVGSW